MSQAINETAWYLVTENGDLSLRLRQSLIIGETDQGELAIDSPLRAQRQLRLTPEDGNVRVEVLDESRRLIYAGSSDINFPNPSSLEPGTAIELDCNTVFLNTGIANATAIIRLQLQHRPARQVPTAPPTPPPPAAAVPATDPSETIGDVQTAKSDPDPSLPPTAAKRPGSKILVNLLFGIIVLATVIAFDHFTSAPQRVTTPVADDPPEPKQQSEPEPMAEPEPEPEPMTEPEPAQIIAGNEPVELPSEPDPVSPVVSDAEQVVEAEAQPEPAPAAPPDPFVARRLRAAQTYLDDGQITEPPGRNAVYELKIVLYRDPGNDAALALMGECADRVLQAAVAAQEAGLEFEARNLLEELLAFHPDHDTANRLWAEWTGSNR